MNFETSKNLSGTGAILIFISAPVIFVPGISIFGTGVLALVGLILMLIGVKGLAEYYNDAGIYNNILYGSITGIVGAVVSVVVAAVGFLTVLPGLLDKFYPGVDWSNFSHISSLPTPDTSNLTFSDIAPFIAIFLAVFVILFVFTLVVALFFRKSLPKLQEKSGVGFFGSISTVLLIGAALTIIGIGYLIVWIFFLLLAIAFFQIRPSAPASATMTYQT
jgi:uncharacterized membrane protein